jgi:hypothetical protein
MWPHRPPLTIGNSQIWLQVREESRFLKKSCFVLAMCWINLLSKMAISENISLKSGNFGKKIHCQMEKVSTKKL